MDARPDTPPPRFIGTPHGLPEPSDDAREAKRALRRELLAGRDRRPAALRAEAGAALARVVTAWLPEGTRAVAAYAGVGAEPPTRPLLDALRGRGITVLLPVVHPDRSMDWAAYETWEALVAGPIGLREPAGARQAADALARVDLVLAPALAVDRRGVRLGRGAGYYDRALAAVPRERVAAVVYDDEVLDVVPAEPHDAPVGAAVTPSGVVALVG